MSTSEESLESTEGILRRWNLSVIKENVRRIWAAMHSPERGPEDYPPEADERRILISIIKRQMDRAGVQIGNANGSGQKYPWLINAVIVVILGLSAWNLKATIENTVAISVLQCQVNPACAQAVTRGP